MAFGFVILAAVLLLLVAFAGLGYYAIPIAVVGFAALGFLLASRARQAGGGTSSNDEGEYAHTGQATMTPEQMKRAR